MNTRVYTVSFSWHDKRFTPCSRVSCGRICGKPKFWALSDKVHVGVGLMDRRWEKWQMDEEVNHKHYARLMILMQWISKLIPKSRQWRRHTRCVGCVYTPPVRKIHNVFAHDFSVIVKCLAEIEQQANLLRKMRVKILLLVCGYGARSQNSVWWTSIASTDRQRHRDSRGL